MPESQPLPYGGDDEDTQEWDGLDSGAVDYGNDEDETQELLGHKFLGTTTEPAVLPELSPATPTLICLPTTTPQAL